MSSELNTKDEKYQAEWRKKLLQASFRGASFFVRTSDTRVGRKTLIHTYPQRDKIYAEDMGLQADEFDIQAFVLGPNYTKARDALIDALKEPGPGQLIHPLYGEKRVALSAPVAISENFENGGQAIFTLRFVDAPESSKPAFREDTQQLVDAKATLSEEAIKKAFEDQTKTIDSDFFKNVDDAIKSIEGVITKAYSTVDKVKGYLFSAERFIRRITNIIRAPAAIVQSLLDMKRITSIIRAPAAIAQSFLAMIADLKMLFRLPKDALKAYQGIFSAGKKTNINVINSSNSVGSVNTSYTSDGFVGSNHYSGSVGGVYKIGGALQETRGPLSPLTTLVRRAALINAARMSAQMTYSTSNEAIALRDELATLLEEEASGVIRVETNDGGEIKVEAIQIPVEDEVYEALCDLRVAVIKDLTERSIHAARLDVIETKAVLPALVVAYQYLGDANREAELLDRNSIVHPGFVPAGVSLEVLRK